MAQVTLYSDFYPQMLGDLPGMDGTHLMLQAMQRIGRHFAEKTNNFREDLDPIPVVDYQQDYALTTMFDASIHRLIQVRVNERLQPLRAFGLHRETRLRFTTNYIPTNTADMLLTCGAVGSSTLADWTALTDASTGVTIGGSSTALTGMDFSGASDFDDVANTMQTTLRAALESNLGIVRPVYNNAGTLTKFVFWVHSGTIGYLTADATGTDISGASWLNGLTGTGTTSGILGVYAILRPDINTQTMRTWWLDHWGEAIQAGATWWLADQSNRPWSNPDLAARKDREYKGWITTGLAWVSKQGKSGALDFDNISESTPAEFGDPTTSMHPADEFWRENTIR